MKVYLRCPKGLSALFECCGMPIFDVLNLWLFYDFWNLV